MNINKQIIKLVSLFFIIFTAIPTSYAIKITIENPDGYVALPTKEHQENISSTEVFSFFADFYREDTPETYKYIALDFYGIENNSKLADALQILVYNNKIKNLKIGVDGNNSIQAYSFYKLANKILNIDISGINTDIISGRNVNSDDTNFVAKLYAEIKNKEKEARKSEIEKDILFRNVYETIKNQHYNKDDIDEQELIYSAIEGLAKGTKDKHTVFFPPVKSKDFTQSLTGDFEGIGAYVELKEPGKFMIVSPIPGSPAEKAGLRGGDQVIKAGKNEITAENPKEEIISWIKGPAGTKVMLTILREGKELQIEVKRGKIHISNMDYELKDNKVHYIQIKNFGTKAGVEFGEVLEEINNSIGVKKIVFDFRNNGGGFLDEVVEMLSHLIPKGENTAIIKYLGNNKVYTSKGYNTIDLNEYEVVILQNSGTASASEIMIGTLKDYFPDIRIIGEVSYGKGSVQTIKNYIDGSSLKYTIAKWFTGKTQTGIDGTGITPDYELSFNQELYTSEKIDNQLEEALK